MIVEYDCEVIVLSIRRKSHLSAHLGKVNNPWYSRKQTRKLFQLRFVRFKPVCLPVLNSMLSSQNIFLFVLNIFLGLFWRFLKFFEDFFDSKISRFFSKWVFSIRNGSSRIYLSRDCTSLWAVHLPVKRVIEIMIFMNFSRSNSGLNFYSWKSWLFTNKVIITHKYHS